MEGIDNWMRSLGIRTEPSAANISDIWRNRRYMGGTTQYLYIENFQRSGYMCVSACERNNQSIGVRMKSFYLITERMWEG